MSLPKKRNAPHVDLALAYCRAVEDGTQPACKWVVAACRRHIEDHATAEDPASQFDFDAGKAEAVCRFIEKLPHVKGKWARAERGNPLSNRVKLEPWQCFIVCSIFGWVYRATRLRRFTRATVFVPRKNGKSLLSAAIGWWFFAMDNEPGAEVYCAAGSRAQAWEVFGIARQMAVAEPALSRDLSITLNAQSLVRQQGASLSKYETVIGKPGDGASPSCAIIDEYHEHPTSEAVDTLKTGMGAREQPLLLIISTAGLNIAGPCRDHWNQCEKLLAGTVQDDRHFALIYTIDDPDKWSADDALRVANPNWGVSVLPESILPERDLALREAREQGSFKTKHLNLWCTANAAFYNVEQWQRLKDPELRREAYHGRRCVIACDLASKVDLAAALQVIPEDDGSFVVFGRYYLPDETVSRPENQHYRQWKAEGWLTVTSGNITDFERIREDLLDDCREFDVAEVPLDPFQATLLITQLNQAGVPAYEFRQTVLGMSEPMKHLDALIRSGKILHDGNPITAWCISNVVAHLDAKDNVYPRKENPSLKIDGAVALIMALARAALGAGEMGDSPGCMLLPASGPF